MNHTQEQKISVVIPCYNHGRFLTEAVTSVVNQTYKNWECIIVNDGSNDNTSQIANDLIKIYDKQNISLIEKTNSGVIDSRNIGVEKSQGNFILFLDADDKIHPNFLKETLTVLIENPEVGFVYVDVQYFGYKTEIVQYSDFNPQQFLYSNQATVTSLFRKKIYTIVGGFKKEMEFAWEDWEFWISVYESGWQGYHLAKPYLYYRQHQTGSRQNRLEFNPVFHVVQKARIVTLHPELYSDQEVKLSTKILIEYEELSNNKVTTLSVVVPWWDHTEFLELWENNLKYLPNCEIIFIDNGSNEENKKTLEGFCKKHNIELIRNQENRGFSAANNQGLAVATGDYVLHLNNDLSIKKLDIQHICSLAGEGIAGPGEAQNELYIPYVEGWGLCVKKSILEKLGGWNEIYGPGYWDDVDLCYRAKLAGYPVIGIPEMSQWIEHITNATGRDGRLEQITLHVTNRKKFIDQYFNISPKIIIDGVFFQLYKTGIARVWKSLLEEWANTEFADHILVLDRANTAPKINGIRYRAVSPYNYNDTESDRQMLQQICDEEGAELFISTYYTTPINTPSVFMAYDMIPEVLGGNLSEPMWREKHNAIKHASAFISISENTARDLSRFFPDISLESITVAHCGVDPLFSPASENEINAFKYKYGINKPYFLLSGLGGYKNSILFLQAFAQLNNKHSFDIVATGAGNQLPPEWRQYTAGCTFHGLQLSDEELRLAYAGAVALVYPSQYEGFGMPVAEAMACGCPVITTPNASLPEVGGEAVIYVKDDDIEGMTNALCEVQKPSLRRNLIEVGLKQAHKFSWSKMADIVSNVLINQALDIFKLREINLIMFPDWTQSEDDLYLQLGEVIIELANSSDADKSTLLIYAGDTDPETADLVLSSIAMNLMMEYEIDITEKMQISLIEEINQKLLPNLHSRIVLEVENQEAIAKYNAENLPDFEVGV